MNEAIIEQIRTLTEPLLEGTDMFIVNIKIKPTNNIKLYLDADSGLNIAKSASVNRKLAALIEESGMFPDGDFSLEVSSPGVDEPLVSMRQYKKNVGRTVLITYHNEETPETLGVLKEITEDEKLVLEVKVGKKKEIQQVEIPVADIKKTVVQIIF
jgi:ribosome maturation factor RimP